MRFAEADFWRGLRQLVDYDPDQIQALYVTPHRWTPFYETVQERAVLRTDTRRWDYKHQVLETPGVPPWRVFLWFKTIELVLQLRPRAIARVLFHPDAEFRHAMRWYTRIGRRVWFHEVAEFLFGARLLKSGPTLREFLGRTLASREYALNKRKTVPIKPIQQAKPAPVEPC